MIMNYQYYQETNPTFHVLPNQTFEREKYTLVYTDTIDTNDYIDEYTDNLLDVLYRIHNGECRPRATEIRSMSVGDIIVLTDEKGNKEAFVCDSEGWNKIDFDC